MPTCFVVMGFGEKTAFYGGKKKQRLLNLDMTYQHIIKPAVTAAGYECVRADEILHSGVIEKPMYERLLDADIVVADLSTSNPNAIYELGVRHALKPWSTIVIAEDEFKFPFDVAHLSILKYKHLGPDIGAGEAQRMTAELERLLHAVGGQNEVDSPVFVFLPQLRPDQDQPPPKEESPPAPAGPSLAELSTTVAECKKRVKAPSDWLVVAEKLEELQKLQPDDPHVVQQLALATYKSEQPDKLAALVRAKEVLEVLCPRVSSDAETVGLWGAIHKRLWEQGQVQDDLSEAIRAYARGFLLRYNHYNGINYAYLLDVRAGTEAGDEAVADRVMAARARREVLAICDELLEREARGEPAAVAGDRYWLRASRIEALLGLGRADEANRAFAEAKAMQPTPEGWMVDSTMEQLAKLGALLPSTRAAA